MSTTRDEIDEVVRDVETFCRYAEQLVQSFTPIGLGARWKADRDAIVMALADASERFEKSIRAAQEKGWATATEEPR